MNVKQEFFDKLSSTIYIVVAFQCGNLFTADKWQINPFTHSIELESRDEGRFTIKTEYLHKNENHFKIIFPDRPDVVRYVYLIQP